ncbi:MAG: Extracellular solute-binding protein [Chloroflexi bacterium]|nr:Extracellular solute-binding protein [Chloroflexota bacterium]
MVLEPIYDRLGGARPFPGRHPDQLQRRQGGDRPGAADRRGRPPPVPRGRPHGVGGGAVSLVEGGPNPNAGKVFVNWLLSRDGQMSWQEHIRAGSLRLDVPKDHLDQDTLPRPGLRYIDASNEEYAALSSSEIVPLIERTLRTEWVASVVRQANRALSLPSERVWNCLTERSKGAMITAPTSGDLHWDGGAQLSKARTRSSPDHLIHLSEEGLAQKRGRALVPFEETMVLVTPTRSRPEP